MWRTLFVVILILLMGYRAILSVAEATNTIYLAKHKDSILVSSRLERTEPTLGSNEETFKRLKMRERDSKKNKRDVFYSTESKTKNNSSLNADLFFSHAFQPRKVKNYASTDVDELQFKRTLLPQETLKKLRKALLVHPFKTWKLRHKFASMKDIRIHEKELRAVTDNVGNGRLKQKLRKVLRGEDVYLDVFGGSNTSGGGLRKDVGGVEGIYPKVITHWWRKTITPITGSNLKVRLLARGGVSCDFLQFCFDAYIQKQVDLVFIEMAVNDLRERPMHANKSIPLEQLTRQLLAYPSEPALIYVNAFDGTTCKTGCTNLQDYGLDVLSGIYKITSLRWRDAVCPRLAGNRRSNLKDCDVIASDGYHMNQLGHAHFALMIINVFRTTLLDHISTAIAESTWGLVYRAVTSLRGNITRGTVLFKDYPTRERKPALREVSRDLPPPLFIPKSTNIISKPLCWTSQPLDLQNNVITNNLNVFVSRNNGFYMLRNNEVVNCVLPCQFDEYGNWTGHTVGATTSLWFIVPPRFSADGVSYRSVVIAVRASGPEGTANMWLDNDYGNRQYITMKLGNGRTAVTIIALRVNPGAHELNMEIVEKGSVSIIALMVGPPDGPYY